MWMYFPQIKTNGLHINMKYEDAVISVEHDYALHPIREMFLASKLQHVVIPLLGKLNKEQLLPINWREILKAALFCCPFLTMNLADEGKFPPEISLLGLAMSVEMGSDSKLRRSKIDRTLDQIEKEIHT
jgi:hypothetical protein